MSTEWMADGKCREVPPETFFPSDGLGVIRAQRICATCAVAVPVPRVRAREPHRPRRVGRQVRARASSHPAHATSRVVYVTDLHA